MIKYSFIVPVYNVDDYLRRCVDSLLDQDFPGKEYEIILVDDGSSDSSGTICDEYSAKYSNVHTIHQGNKGLLLARGEGVRCSHGDYILFVDSDDYVETCLLEVVNGYIEQYSPDFICFGYMTETGTKTEYHHNISQKYKVLDKEGFLSLFAGSDKYNSIWSKVICGDILRTRADEIYDMRLNIGEDRLQTAYIIGDSDNILLISDCLYHYSVRTDSIVHLKVKNDISDIISVNKRVETVINSILDNLQLTSGSRDKLLEDYRANSINGTLDHIYKFNKRRDISCEEKLVALYEIVDNEEGYFNIGEPAVKLLRLYNRFRLRLLARRRFKLLICVDSFLFLLQKCGF